jgi:hypothetical protein
MARAESNLLSFCEELVNIAVKYEFSDGLDGYKLRGPYFSSIKNVEVKVVFVFLLDDLNRECPLWVSPIVNGLVQVFPMEIWDTVNTSIHNLCNDGHTRILTTDFESLVPHQAVDTQLGSHVEFNENAFLVSVDQRIGVHPKALYHSERSGDSPVRHGPHNHVGG